MDAKYAQRAASPDEPEEGQSDLQRVAQPSVAGSNADPYELQRFVLAQHNTYQRALRELRNGRKESHWIWYIFPQIAGLGHSAMAHTYSIESAGEARAYLQHPLLGARLVQCAEALLGIEGKSAAAILGSPDDLKVKSCATLFAAVTAAGSVFERLLAQYYGGERDAATLQILARAVNTQTR